jgi:predicted transposase YdaD
MSIKICAITVMNRGIVGQRGREQGRAEGREQGREDERSLSLVISM